MREWREKMQIVIDIPNELYNSVLNETYCGNLYEELKNGIVLPKGHGRLIDDDKLYVEMATSGDWRLTEASRFVFTRMIKNALTIIPSDKEGE
jgi:hypothetical protein